MRRFLFLALCISGVAGAAPDKIAPMTRVLFAHRARAHETFPMFERDRAFEASGALRAVIDFASPPSRAELAGLESAGVTFDERLASGAYLARVEERALAALERDANVARVAPDLVVRAPLPLEESAKETRVETARRALRAKDGTLLDGTGTTIGDVDTGIFIFHPAFFRADGGASRWIDVDKNGAFTPDVDGVDLDASGSVEPEEVLHVLSARPRGYSGAPLARPSDFTPDLDYLYCDSNGNGQRDYGKAFSEDTPAYGEPLFVLDDANHDGKAQPSERVLRLATSKIKAVRDDSTEYLRGGTGNEALVKYDKGTTPNALGALGHATGVAGILIGGVPGVSRWLGLAPGAELVVGAHGAAASTTAQLQWAINKGANVLVTEYAPFAGVTLDGSSADDGVIDAAFAKDIVTVSPAGNLAQSNKHRTITLSSGAPTSVDVVPDGAFANARYMAFSLHERSKRAITLELTLPNMQKISVPAQSLMGTPLGNGVMLYAQTQTTPRGTVERHIQLYRQMGPLGMGTYTFDVSIDAGPDVEADAYVIDELTSWAQGAQFDVNTTSRTICAPSTADSTISVAAYVLHGEQEFGAWGKAGELAGYSSRGPLLGGGAGIELAAPDNPLSAAPSDPSGPVFRPFGGTSGAGPHVAASIALLRQLFPQEGAAALKQRVTSAARPAGEATSWGAGKLDLAKAAGLELTGGMEPRVFVDAPKEAYVGEGVTLTPRVEDDGGPHLARWDLDYDGTFDTGWEPLAPRKQGTPDLGEINAKIEVRDPQGNVGAATVLLSILPARPKPPEPPPPPEMKSGGGCAIGTSGAWWAALVALLGLSRTRKRA